MALCFFATKVCAMPLVNLVLFKPPPRRPYCFPTDVIRLQSSQGNVVCATFIEKPGATVTLLLSHGNAEDLNSSFHSMLKLSTVLDAHVIGYDYSGYGESTGKFEMGL